LPGKYRNYGNLHQICDWLYFICLALAIGWAVV
jgi:hypothetical protein